MGWFNYIGLISFSLIMVPNIIYSFKHKSPIDKGIPRSMTIIENIGRYGCMAFLIFNVPGTWFSFFFEQGIYVYVIVNAVMVATYIALYIVFWNRNGMAKALTLSIIPSLIFLFSGVLVRSILLIACSTLFAIGHIYISVNTIGRSSASDSTKAS